MCYYSVLWRRLTVRSRDGAETELLRKHFVSQGRSNSNKRTSA